MNRQGWVIRGLLLLGMLACWAQAGAQGVPAELHGSYLGTMKTAIYESGKPEKATVAVIITLINASSWAIEPIDETGIVYGGSVAASGQYLFGSVTGSGFVIGGRLQVKGKPGKQKLTGNLTLGSGPFLGIGDVIINVKKAI